MNGMEGDRKVVAVLDEHEASEFRKLLEWMYGREPVIWADLHKRLSTELAKVGR